MTTAQCWLRRALPCFDGTHDTLFTPLRFIPFQDHRPLPPGSGEPARLSPNCRAGNLSQVPSDSAWQP